MSELSELLESLQASDQNLLIAGGVLLLLFVVLLFRKSRRDTNAPAWLVTGLLGLAVGSGAGILGIHYLGFPPAPNDDAGAIPGGAAGGGPADPGGGGTPGGGGPPGGGAGGAQDPTARSRQQLAALVGKLDLLTRGLSLNLENSKAEELAKVLDELGDAEEMTSEQAEGYLTKINATLSEAQQATLESFSVPRRRGGSGGGSKKKASPSGKGRPQGDGNQNANPFQREQLQQRLRDLVSRLEGEKSKD